jgi:thymidine kinase
MNDAYLELIIGPMFSGKTSKIIEIYKQFNYCNIPSCVINHILDKRYDDNLLSTHDGIKIPCIQSDNLTDLWNNNIFKNSKVILINEGQFFMDLKEIVIKMLNNNKRVYICGLDGDYTRNQIGSILDLIPLCDKVTKLASICASCKDGTPGIFTLRLSSEITQIVIGSNNYIPVCRKCYIKQ